MGSGFYDEIFTPDERAAADGVSGDSLEEEIRMLKLLIRRGLVEGSSRSSITSTVDALVRAVRVQHILKGTAAKNLEEALAAALNDIGGELGLNL